MTHELCRKDERYMDFEDVTEGSMILVSKEHELNKWATRLDEDGYIHFEVDDIWIIERLMHRPRVAIIRNLQRDERCGIRVDKLLELDDTDVLTIGPG